MTRSSWRRQMAVRATQTWYAVCVYIHTDCSHTHTPKQISTPYDRSPIASFSQTKVDTGEYTINESAGDEGVSLALDATTGMVYVGGIYSLYKLSAGGPTELPTFLHKLDLLPEDGDTIYGLVLDTANGIGTGKKRGVSLSTCVSPLHANVFETMTI